MRRDFTIVSRSPNFCMDKMWALSDTMIVEERTMSVISLLDLFCLEKQTDKTLSHSDEFPITKYMNMKLEVFTHKLSESQKTNRGQSQMYLLKQTNKQKQTHYICV